MRQNIKKYTKLFKKYSVPIFLYSFFLSAITLIILEYLIAGGFGKTFYYGLAKTITMVCLVFFVVQFSILKEKGDVWKSKNNKPDKVDIAHSPANTSKRKKTIKDFWEM